MMIDKIDKLKIILSILNNLVNPVSIFNTLTYITA